MSYRVRIKPRSERESLITKRVENSHEFGEKIYDFRGETYIPKVISLPVEVPVYRMGNCRTFSAQQTEISRKGLDKNFFEMGQERSDAQQAQHEILVKLANRGTESVTPITTVLQQEGQREAMLITSAGVVVNGNRRLAAMRELIYQTDGSVDERFTNVKCAVLPSDVTRDEVDDIEADLQAKRETKLDYDWIGDARLIRRQTDKGRTAKQVADRLRRSKTSIENVLQALDEADLYLNEWIEKPGEYDLVQAGEQIFGDLPKAIANKDISLQNASRAIAWSIYANKDKISGRLYRLNSAFGKLAPNVLELLEDELGQVDSASEESIDEDDFIVDIDVNIEEKDYSSIINALRRDIFDDETTKTLVDACETAIELDKGQQSEKAALTALARVNSKVAGIDINVAGSSTLPAILKQVTSIRKGLDKIELDIQTRQIKSDSDTNSGDVKT